MTESVEPKQIENSEIPLEKFVEHLVDEPSQETQWDLQMSKTLPTVKLSAEVGTINRVDPSLVKNVKFVVSQASVNHAPLRFHWRAKVSYAQRFLIVAQDVRWF